jgi:hypothetical protein
MSKHIPYQEAPCTVLFSMGKPTAPSPDKGGGSAQHLLHPSGDIFKPEADAFSSSSQNVEGNRPALGALSKRADKGERSTS